MFLYSIDMKVKCSGYYQQYATELRLWHNLDLFLSIP